jgi:tRNA G18 (ribose-2'-O)-methylase SpoU
MTFFSFTKYKFLNLEEKQKHKKLSEILRLIYEETLKKNNVENALSHYHEIIQWINLEQLKAINLETLSDRYHFHLRKAKYNLKENNLLPSIRKNDRKASKEFGALSIYLDNIRSAHNIGSILRTTEAFRLGTVCFSVDTPFINNKKILKTAMGTETITPCIENYSIDTLQKPIIALETSDDAISLHEFIFPKNFTLVLGNEEYGISDSILKKTDYLLEIPLIGIKNSINVACAFAIVAAEIQKQKYFCI